MHMSPVVFVFETLKFKINANDHNPPHVHVEGRGTSIRINLLSLDFMDDPTDFSQGTLDRILDEVLRRKDELMEEWVKYYMKGPSLETSKSDPMSLILKKANSV